MTKNHIVKSYDYELKRLNTLIADMGLLVEGQLAQSIQSLLDQDQAAAERIIERDAMIDHCEYTIDSAVVRMLALRHPVASDLRHVVAAMKVSSHLERIADYATNIAKRAIALNRLNHPLPHVHELQAMASFTQGLIHDVLHAFASMNDEEAMAVWRRDAEVDRMYVAFVQSMINTLHDHPEFIAAGIHLMFIAKNIERIGDHATNIAEVVHFIVFSVPFSEPRPKIDDVFNVCGD
jgi:phosphate transport system protein